MVRYVSEMKGYAIEARDGRIGHVEDLYFDDEKWTVRYLVVDTASLFFGRKVLISPVAVQEIRRSDGSLSVDLTRDQVKGSPDIDTEQPVSRRHEGELHVYYGWRNYWSATGLWQNGMAPTGPMPPAEPASGEDAWDEKDDLQKEESRAEEHLRSVKEVVGYAIHATDGEIGHVADFGMESETWALRWMVVDAGNWLTDRLVPLSTGWVTSVDWLEREVSVNLRRGQIQTAPELVKSEEIGRDYETSLFRHYRQTSYWKQ